MDLDPGTWLGIASLAAGAYFLYRIFNPVDMGDSEGDPSKYRKKNYPANRVVGSKFPLAELPVRSKNNSVPGPPPKFDPLGFAHL